MNVFDTRFKNKTDIFCTIMWKKRQSATFYHI